MMIFISMVQSIMTYGLENWIITKENKSKIKATEIDKWGKFCGFTRLGNIRNEEIRRRIQVNVIWAC